MRLILRWIFLLQHLHVLFHMIAENLLLVGLCIVLRLTTFLISCLETREVLGLVGNMEASVNCTFQCSPHAVPHASASNANIQNALERPLLILLILHVIFFAVKLFLPFELFVQSKLLQDTTGHQEPGGVCCSIVLMPSRDTKMSQLIGGCCGNNHVTSQGGVNTLANDTLVGEANYQSVLSVVELVLVLAHHFAASMIVCLALSAAPSLHLEALEVCGILQHLHKRHGDFRKLP
mmetsp:Transcript_3421/g.5734  ORF Transcript_3421/g.5734 Transcript_3421/m.5734 type:complete len:235 (+) Transcript_3421:355-1059(+)